MKSTKGQVWERLTAVFIDTGLAERKAKDAAFHLTDWFEDLKRLWCTFDEIDSLSNDEIIKVIYGFLAHAPNHLAAASKLAGMGPVTDVFRIGALEEDEEVDMGASEEDEED